MGQKRDEMSAARNIKILVVDDHPFLREGIVGAISSQSDMVLIGEASNGKEAIEQFRLHRPDVTLMDLQMPTMNGTDAIVAIRSEFPTARIVVLTAYKGDIQALRAFKAGAVGYLLKNMLRKELLDTIRIVDSGRRRIPAEIARELGEHIVDDELSEREIEVLKLIAAGTSNKVIAAELSLAETTVKTHVQKILFKLSANDRTHAVTIAVKRGYFELG
ncbi:DNA-binding NarL/FixJ family response regulator [Silvibacterium bohemicum]|uniref:DNA-binding NarL/FixJ family response regulator n=1 Tax=Silvibacterium bohemicum TaxID=1577686 RepID=A0A841K946_9BACT|nr:response regulator transcription factor [Silvibacterium bohemicum]MBB6146814.1 DNA-binding NarL/FixJ family response regulator [Silvibacterium bohemicum]